MSENSLKILNKFLNAGALVFSDMVDMGNEYEKRFYYRWLYKQLYNLNRHGYLRIKKNNKNQSFFHLTPKGKLSVLKYLHLEKIRRGHWDKHWRVIIFDIPESLKKWREYLRKDLKNLGFLPLQESVYITPYPVTGELDELLKDWGLRKYFRYLTVSEIDGEDELKRMFGIGVTKNK